jgi:DNA transformation protein and related proteins
MATKQSTVDFILGQASGAGRMSARKMFGEYRIYCDGKLVALVCDDQLSLKPAKVSRAKLGTATEAAPFPGAMPTFSWRWNGGRSPNGSAP